MLATAMQSAVTSLTTDIGSYAPILFGVAVAVAGVTLAFKFFKRFAK